MWEGAYTPIAVGQSQMCLLTLPHRGIGIYTILVRNRTCGEGANAYLPDAPRSKCGRGLAPDGGLWAGRDVGLDRVHIRFCGHGHLGFRPDGGSLLKSAKVSKTLLPHHSAPRSCSVCLRSRSKADQDQKRLASHRGYCWALLSCVGTYGHRGQAPLPQLDLIGMRQSIKPATTAAAQNSQAHLPLPR